MAEVTITINPHEMPLADFADTFGLSCSSLAAYEQQGVTTLGQFLKLLPGIIEMVAHLGKEKPHE